LSVRIHRALPAGAAVLLLVAMDCGGSAQTMDLRGTNEPGSRGSEFDIAQPAASDFAQPAPSAPPPAPAPLAPLRDSVGQPVLGAEPDPGGMINYGKPKPKKAKLYKLYKPDPKASPPLPPLAPYATAPGLRKKTLAPATDQTDPDAPVNTPAPNFAVVPSPPPLRRLPPDPEPFAPLGIDVGSLRLFPFVETGVGYDSNPNRLASFVQGSSYLRADGGLRLESEWSQHSLTADLHGGYSDYLQFPPADRPDASGTIVARIDVLRDTQINSTTSFNLATQQPGSPQIAIPGSVFIVNRPLILSYGEALGVTQTFNRLQVSLRGGFDRYTFGNALQSDGTMLLLSSEDYNDYGLQGRVGYEVTPGIIPFVQIGGDLRRHDQYLDFNGFARDSDGAAAKIGTRFELTRLLTGELALGYAERIYADPRLPRLAAPTIDGSLAYPITPLTTISLHAATDLSETTDAFAAGAVSHTISLEIDHALLRDLLVKAIGTYQNYTFVGEPVDENLFSASLGADYSLTRNIVLRANYTYEQMQSNVPGSNYTANVFLVGLRLQR